MTSQLQNATAAARCVFLDHADRFPGRNPAGCVLVRAFLGGACFQGGACRPELLELSEEELAETADREPARLLGIRGATLVRHLTRWRQVTPQYHVGHGELFESIESRVANLRGVELAGNAYHGIGVPNCIHSGERAAERVAAELELAPRRLPTP